ncbi:Histidine kinase-, DNA gyrase B-, and HSP90-like ATPase [Thiohalomonas denitrificans]|uniref:histidine kinase n=1 Tax=Thiohalomonas denitrificans TaxID=415747 RepID=A0A1G5R0F2_9GAMM|nr:Histidine kinase-, DNA gyrase B-, and HSP90-like ATPase [Thiohalomonas denitrificans]
MQVFYHLIANALEHNDKPEGHVWISGRDVGAFHEFSVADNGPGISKEYQERVFEIFQRLDPSKGAGIGIGLAITKKLAEGAGGQIEVDSKSGKGATFRFTWPKQMETTML